MTQSEFSSKVEIVVNKVSKKVITSPGEARAMVLTASLSFPLPEYYSTSNIKTLRRAVNEYVNGNRFPSPNVNCLYDVGEYQYSFEVRPNISFDGVLVKVGLEYIESEGGRGIPLKYLDEHSIILALAYPIQAVISAIGIWADSIREPEAAEDGYFNPVLHANTLTSESCRLLLSYNDCMEIHEANEISMNCWEISAAAREGFQALLRPTDVEQYYEEWPMPY